MNEKLTQREQEILQYLIKGMTNKQIATDLYISVHTVKAHVSEILRKINVKNRLNAAVFAVSNIKTEHKSS